MKLISLSPPFFIPTKKNKKKKNANKSRSPSISQSDPPTFGSTSSLEQSVHLHNQTISKRELEAVLRRMAVTEEELATILTEADKIPSIIKMEQADEAELRETFSMFDTDGDGRISAEELWEMLIMLGDEDCTLDDCRQMIGLVDQVGDGFVCFDDFVRMMSAGLR